MTDAIDALAGIAPGSALDTIRRQKPITRDNAQASFDALFSSADTAEMSATERGAVALFVAALHGDEPATDFYRRALAATGATTSLIANVLREANEAATSGPYGHYPPGPLDPENTDGLQWSVSAPGSEALGARLCAAIAHTHMLVFHLRDAAPAHLRALEAAGWSATGIVTLSQLVAFLAFQLRAAHGLRALAENPA